MFPVVVYNYYIYLYNLKQMEGVVKKMKTVLPKEPIFNYNEWMQWIHKQVNETKNVKK